MITCGRARCSAAMIRGTQVVVGRVEAASADRQPLDHLVSEWQLHAPVHAPRAGARAEQRGEVGLLARGSSTAARYGVMMSVRNATLRRARVAGRPAFAAPPVSPIDPPSIVRAQWYRPACENAALAGTLAAWG